MNEHGELLLSWEQNMLIIRANGSFNEEGALAGIKAIKKSVLTKNLNVWYRLGFWNEDYLASPSTL